MAETVYLTLDEARAMIDRGVEKARELRQAGAIVVVDAGGNVVSIARMDDGPVSSINVSRAKAYLAAVQGRPTAAFAVNAHERPEIFSAFQAILPRQPFPGAGGVPIFKNGRVVGGIATGGGIGPYTEIAGVDADKLTANGAPANAEDLVICTALGIPYQSQHGDRALREASSRLGSPVGALPLGLAQARVYADRAIEAANAAGTPIGVAVVDELGRLILTDRMDESPLLATDLAEAKAMTALKFRRSTTTLAEEFRGNSARLRAIEKMAGFTILALGGGLPIESTVDSDVASNGHEREKRMVGAIGIAGSGARTGGGQDADIAKAALAE